jgi:GNAT superfamily N-acetyltransferase
MELIFNLIMVTTKQPDFLYTILPKRIMEFGSVFFLKNNRSKKMNSLLNERRGLMYELKAIIVIKNYQGQNIAMKLLDHSEDILRAKGEKKYFLGVLQDNLRAINFYKKAGFLVMGSERNNALIMEKILT